MGKIKVTHDCNGIEGLKVIEPGSLRGCQRIFHGDLQLQRF